jgi:hypothetical protein
VTHLALLGQLVLAEHPVLLDLVAALLALKAQLVLKVLRALLVQLVLKVHVD